MWQKLFQLFRSPGLRFALRLFASLASAILVVSGLILFRTKKSGHLERGLEEDEPLEGEVIEADEEPKTKASVHFLFRAKKP